MKTILVPGVCWPEMTVEPPPVVLQRGGHRTKLTEEEVRWLCKLRKGGKSLHQLQQIFHRGKATLIAACNRRGPYEGYL